MSIVRAIVIEGRPFQFLEDAMRRVYRCLGKSLPEAVYKWYCYHRYVRPLLNGSLEPAEAQARFWHWYGVRWMRIVRKRLGAMTDRDPLARFPDKTLRITEEILSLNPSIVFEFGCGYGLLLQALRSRRPDLALAGVDVSSEQLRVARYHIPGADLRQVEPGQRIESGRRYDTVVCSGVLTTVPPDGLVGAIRGLIEQTDRYLVIEDAIPVDGRPLRRDFVYPGIHVYMHEYPPAVERAASQAGRTLRLEKQTPITSLDGTECMIFVYALS